MGAITVHDQKLALVRILDRSTESPSESRFFLIDVSCAIFLTNTLGVIQRLGCIYNKDLIFLITLFYFFNDLWQKNT